MSNFLRAIKRTATIDNGGLTPAQQRRADRIRERMEEQAEEQAKANAPAANPVPDMKVHWRPGFRG